MRLNGVATSIGAVGLSVAAAVLVVLIVRYHTYDLANKIFTPFFPLLFCYFLFLFLCRYFLGHTKNADGTIQYIKGQTSTKQTVNGVIKILTVAVSILNF